MRRRLVAAIARRVRRWLAAWWCGLAALAGAGLVGAGMFRDLGGPARRGPPGAGAGLLGELPAVAVLALGGLLVARLSSVMGSLGKIGAAGGGRPSGAAPRPGAPFREPGDWKSDLQLGLLLLACAYAAFQATGGARSLLHPLAYGLVAFLVTFQRRWVGLALVGAALVLEVLLSRAGLPVVTSGPAARGHHAPLHDDTALLVSHVAFLGFFALLHALFLHAEVARQRFQHRARLEGEVRRLKDEARDFRLISSQLAAESRTRTREQEEEIIAAASVENIHQALFYTLELLKKSLDLHTCLLLWLDDASDDLRIKELVTDSDAIADAPIAVDAGAVGAVVKDRVPLRLAAPKPEHLPYYESAQPVGAFLGVPVIEEAGAFPAPVDDLGAPALPHAVRGGLGLGVGDGTAAGEARRRGHLRGVLCADRLVTRVEDGTAAAVPFDERDERLLVGAAREILRAIQAERVFVAVERGKYEHERFFHASDLLNRALTPEQVFETAFTAARKLCDFDFAAIALFDKATRRHRVVAAVGDGADEVRNLEYGENAGLAAMAVKNKHPLPSTGERRDKEMPVYTKKVKLKGMESLLVMPLIAADEAIGTFTLAARATRRFGKDKRELLGVIANQVAVSTKNAEMYRAMEQMATTDGLTGLVNHRTFQERFADLIARAERQGQSITLLLTDIDHFKKVNDTHGHPTGDVVLKGVAGVCRAQVRKIDVAARYGGEEFSIVLDGTDRDGGRLLAERIRREVAAQSFSSEKGPFGCTLSLGIATYPDDGRDPKTLIAHADQALYHAKHHGRNCAVAWPDVQAAASAAAAAAATPAAPPLRAVR